MQSPQGLKWSDELLNKKNFPSRRTTGGVCWSIVRALSREKMTSLFRKRHSSGNGLFHNFPPKDRCGPTNGIPPPPMRVGSVPSRSPLLTPVRLLCTCQVY